MNYKNANKIRFWGMSAGIIFFGMWGLIFGVENETLLNIGIGITALIEIISMLAALIYYRCPDCADILPWNPIVINNCPHCGCDLHKGENKDS